MPTLLDNLIKRREDAAEKAHSETMKEVSVWQTLGYLVLIEWIFSNVETEEGAIKYSSKNLGAVSGIYRVFRTWNADFRALMLRNVLSKTGEILRENEAYYDAFEGTGNMSESDFQKAVRLTLQRWGYQNDAITPGSYFEALFSNDRIAQQVARLMNAAILQQMPLSDFRESFRAVFVGANGRGLLENHWRTNSFDLYQRIDRTINLLLAERLGYRHAIYSGTLMLDSRPFCRERVNKVFEREAIESWEDLEFAGRPKIGYNPLTDCGGYNCRHHLSWISEELAESLKK
jgi:hypothetical protein